MGREGMSRRHAFYKMVAIVLGTNIVRKELRIARPALLADILIEPALGIWDLEFSCQGSPG